METTEQERVPETFRDPGENVNAEPTSATIDMTDAPNPTKTVDVNDVTSNKSNCQAAYADTFTNLSEGVRHVSALCVDAKFQVEMMGRFANTCADILFDDVSVESFSTLVAYASSAKDEEIGGVNKNNSCVNGRASMNEKVSTTVDDPVNASLAEDEEIGYVNKDGSRDSGNASLNEKASASLDDSPSAKRKFAPWKLLMKRKNSSRNENSLKNKIGEKG